MNAVILVLGILGYLALGALLLRVEASKDTFEAGPVAPTLKDQEDPDGQA